MTSVIQQNNYMKFFKPTIGWRYFKVKFNPMKPVDKICVMLQIR